MTDARSAETATDPEPETATLTPEQVTVATDSTDEVTAALIAEGGYALFVADFSDIDSAWEAYQQLQHATKADRLDIEGAMVLQKSDDGDIRVQKATDYRTRRGLTWGLVGGVVIGALFPPSILASAAVVGAAGAGIGRLRHLHNRDEVAEELAQAIDPGHSGLVVLVSDPAVIEINNALTKANRVVQKAVDEAVAADIRAEAQSVQKNGEEAAHTPRARPPKTPRTPLPGFHDDAVRVATELAASTASQDWELGRIY